MGQSHHAASITRGGGLEKAKKMLRCGGGGHLCGTGFTAMLGPEPTSPMPSIAALPLHQIRLSPHGQNLVANEFAVCDHHNNEAHLQGA
ncbi:hypothetical protein [Pseudooceanicola sp.]|uniref:hypothetical protein n=1 Tax=Pseudooceanicola sp. TaxID=1914328 RepID=UPI0026363EC0|nr:hypothetical protein [Pseudooceanicola sp.]MDF1854300.1 hypothetical protein [Pseudooceanicola sp.]